MITNAYVGIAIALYLVLRQYHPHLTFGFASFRVIAGGSIILGVMLQAGRDLVNHIATFLAVSLSCLMY